MTWLYSISDVSPDVRCFRLDLKTAEGDASERLAVPGLPLVVFFRNGEKIGEIVGQVNPKQMQRVIAKHLSGIQFPPETAPSAATRPPPLPSQGAPRGCQTCRMESIIPMLPSHPKDGMTYVQNTVNVQKLLSGAEGCSYCRFVLDTCKRDVLLFEHVEAVGGDITINSQRNRGLARLFLEGSASKPGMKKTERFRSRILQRPEKTEEHFGGRLVPRQLDFGRYQRWLANCVDCHSTACSNQDATTDAYGLRLRLIDLNAYCVVDAPKGCARYAALSYVWGTAKRLELVRGNYQQLRSVGALSNKCDEVPKTIRDAMLIAKSLDFEYLWVDALCIKQDDAADQAHQIQQMDKVYGFADLTIVSTGPNSDSEVPGLHSPRTTPEQAACRISNLELINTPPTLSQVLSASSWDHRGWTLQEKALSRRLLIFTPDQVYWHCNKAIYAEDTQLELSRDPRNLGKIVEHYEEYSAELRRIYKPSPAKHALSQYVSLLRSYVTRSLTSQGDVVKAFTGVLNSLRSELGTHHHGLPTLEFDAAMLWQTAGHFPGRREEAFPSWSWAGWRGGADVELNEGGLKPVSKIIWWKMGDAGASPAHVRLIPGDAEVESYTNEFFGVDSSTPPPRPDIAPIDCGEEPKERPPRSHILRFWTSSARFTIGRTAVRSRGDTCSEYPVYVPAQKDRGSVSTIILDRAWLGGRAEDDIDMIFLSRVGGADQGFKYDVKVWTMAVTWSGGVAYRVQQFVFPLRLTSWESAKPQFRLITLA
ncbi:heterokaryon incompatibility protein-domain-containing protein [Lasiosphaeria hispida]|uniref:Heterokaryon incompatibility protein-domain-containing protein n=1 Tax=Lasiosphaeria hispida TaxID=260671 RepID=A0AAJ0HN57_9PEZI|nr:heterokaryon incompatibility protein-domain-containing protein [Lasiosphaeria hispida]